MQTVTLTAPDISCAHCQQTVEREVGSLPGVQAVSVDVPTKRVNVTYDPGQTSEVSIVARLDEAGYPVAGEGQPA